MDKSIVVPFGLFISVVYTIKLLVDARMRYLIFRSGEPATAQALFQGEDRLRDKATLRSGMVLTACAVGVGVVSATGWPAFSAPAVATLLAALGLGQLAAFATARKLARGTERAGL